MSQDKNNDWLYFKKTHNDAIRGSQYSFGKLEAQIEKLLAVVNHFENSIKNQILTFVFGRGETGNILEKLKNRFKLLGHNNAFTYGSEKLEILENSIFCVGTGSGQTTDCKEAIRNALAKKAFVILFTSEIENENEAAEIIGKNGIIIELGGRTKLQLRKHPDYAKRQLKKKLTPLVELREGIRVLGAQFEMNLHLCIEIIVSLLMLKTGQVEDDMRRRHKKDWQKNNQKS